MKRVLIGDGRDELLSTLEILLKNWGYRALSTTKPEQFHDLLKELSPDLLLLGPDMLADSKVKKSVDKLKTPILHLAQNNGKKKRKPEPDTISCPVDIFALFEQVQAKLEKVPRRNIRLRVKMPGIYYHGDTPSIAEVMSLSSAGLFIKTGTKIEKEFDQVHMILPLLGMNAELEIDGRVVYQVSPTPENNYLQGMGIEFVDVDEQTGNLLQRYVEGLLFSELSDNNFAREALDMDQLKNQPHELILHINPEARS